MRTPNPRVALLLPLLGLAVGGVSASAASTPKAASACADPRVTGVSLVIDSLQTGSALGPGIAYAAAVSVLGQALPGALGTAQNELLAAVGKGTEVISTSGPVQINRLRADVALLAAYNRYGNNVIDLSVKTLNALADREATAIHPFDLTVHQLAGTVSAARESDDGC